MRLPAYVHTMMHRSNRQPYLNSSMEKLVEPDPHQLMSVLGALMYL